MIFLTSPLVILACRVFVQHKSEQEYINDTPLHVYYCMRVAHTSRAPFFGTWPGGSLFSLPLEYFSEFSFSRFASRQLIPLVGAWVPNKLVVWVYRYHIFSVDLYFLQIARIQNSDLFYFVFLFRKFCYLPYLARTFVFAHKHTCALHATNIYACNLPGIAAHLPARKAARGRKCWCNSTYDTDSTSVSTTCFSAKGDCLLMNCCWLSFSSPKSLSSSASPKSLSSLSSVSNNARAASAESFTSCSGFCCSGFSCSTSALRSKHGNNSI